jgi:hypothetical protein
MTGTHDGRRAQKIRIYIRHHNDPDGKFAPQQATCETDPEKHRVGCGGTIWFYRTYPNEKRMPFDGPPTVVDSTQMLDGSVIATVETHNVHFATCPKRERPAPRPTTGFRDGRAAAAGE